MSEPQSPGEQPVDAAAIAAVFGDAVPAAQRYAHMLRGDGVAHGHLGPREADRVWERHLLNCAVVTDLVPDGARVIDVGSGAGLPGLPMALRRSDLRVTLVEPMLRRVEFLQRCVEELGLGEQVDVVRGRAEDPGTVLGTGTSRVVTARAVAPLDRLVRWCLPLLDDGGVLLALKGERAEREAAEHAVALRRMGVAVRSIEERPAGASVSRVVVLERMAAARRAGRVSTSGRTRREGRGGR